MDIENLDSLFAKLDSLGSMAVKAIESGLKKGIKYTQDEAKALCPVDTGDLRASIKTRVEVDGDRVAGIVATNNDHAAFVEFGTGPVGRANHAGISPEVTPAYRDGAWWIHEGPGPNEISREVAEKYHFFYIDTPEGRFYKCNGQPAQPFLYPAVNATKGTVAKIVSEVAREELLKAVDK